MIEQQPLDPLIEGYLDYLLEVSRKAPRTVVDVRCTLRHVVAAMETIRPGASLWKVTLEDYLRWLELERDTGRSGRCLCKYLSHIRGLLDYAWRSGRADRNVLDGFALQDDHERDAPRPLSLEEAARLVEACTNRSPAERRDRMVVLLLYGCGLRTQELCQLNVEHVNIERRELFIAHGKGDRQRAVPIPEVVFTELLAYLHERGGKRGPLFRTEAKRARISEKLLGDLIRRTAERARLDRRVTPRTLRHSYATHMMDAGVDLAVISSLMGHRSPSETGVYLHVLDDKPRQAVKRLPFREGGKQ
jgi:site-specific recombinase XerD